MHRQIFVLDDNQDINFSNVFTTDWAKRVHFAPKLDTARPKLITVDEEDFNPNDHRSAAKYK